MLQRTQQRRELSYSGPDELHWTGGAAPRRLDLHDIYTFVKSNWRDYCRVDDCGCGPGVGLCVHCDAPLYGHRGTRPRLAENPVIQQQRASGGRQLTRFVAGRKRGHGSTFGEHRARGRQRAQADRRSGIRRRQAWPVLYGLRRFE